MHTYCVPNIFLGSWDTAVNIKIFTLTELMFPLESKVNKINKMYSMVETKLCAMERIKQERGIERAGFKE